MKITFGLGTVGLQTKARYVDLFVKPYRGCFINDGVSRRWYSWRGRLMKLQVLDHARMEQVFRRTMKPWAVLETAGGQQVECTSFPCQQDGDPNWYVYARREIGEPCTAEYMLCERLRPMRYTR